jgi:hypothetical protein
MGEPDSDPVVCEGQSSLISCTPCTDQAPYKRGT